MKTEYSYKMKQTQKLAMTKEMQLSIKILQMSSEELSEFVEKEFVDNPVIEINENSAVNIKEFDFNIFNSKRNYSNANDVSPLNFVSKEKSLKEYLHEQILEMEKDKVIRKTADYIVECLNDSGYFEMKEEDISQRLSVDKGIVEKALKFIQSLEPYGVGARNLKECLLIQIYHLNLEDDIIVKIVNNNLDDIGNDNYKKISKELNITRAEVQRYSRIIKSLEPRPSRGFYTGEDYKFIIPDAEIRKDGENLEIIMNDQAVPRIVISNMYKKILDEKKDDETERYVKDKLVRAEFLIKSIEERKNTLKRILEFIVDKQYEYFIERKKFLKPMTIKEAAETLNCSESTVSRAVKDKFILTSSGVIKIKDLFTVNSIKNSSKNMSVSYIKSIIEKIINAENKKNPISDQEIVEGLKKIDIGISRRTVAKYREEMGIKSSHKRKIF